MGTGWFGTEVMDVFTLGPFQGAVGHAGSLRETLLCSGGLISIPTSGPQMFRIVYIYIIYIVSVCNGSYICHQISITDSHCLPAAAHINLSQECL